MEFRPWASISSNDLSYGPRKHFRLLTVPQILKIFDPRDPFTFSEGTEKSLKTIIPSTGTESMVVSGIRQSHKPTLQKTWSVKSTLPT